MPRPIRYTAAMTSARVEIVGTTRSRVLILDGLTGAADRATDIAAGLGPFPMAQGSLYPGARRPITPADRDASGYAHALLRAAVPYINQVFGTAGFDLLDASFSIVTTAPGQLAPAQRAPHFDSTDPAHLAVLHYISGLDGSGTAFFRQCATGIERVTEANVATFVAATEREAATTHGYIQGSTGAFDRIGLIEAIPDRVIVYQGSLLHSGIIPPDLPLDPDPRRGRLTGNFFVRGRPHASEAQG